MSEKKTSKKTVAKKTAVKKVTAKKAALSSSAASKALTFTFNKENAKRFADTLYSDKGGMVRFLKLCSGALSNGKDDGRTLHCALGEAYFTFVDTDVKGFVKTMEKKHGGSSAVRFSEDDPATWYRPKYVEFSDCEHLGTIAVVDALVEKAVMRNQNPQLKKELAQALLETMGANDDACGIGLEEDLERAQDVAEVWNTQVIPLLK